MKKENSKNGFTIIEVSLVLAIAGLIFLMVFIALPALQRSQRDGRRRDDVGKLLTAMQKYQNNNRGALPSENGIVEWKNDKAEGGGKWAELYDSFLGKDFEDPSGYLYRLSIVDCSASTGAKCSNGNGVNADNASFDANNYTMHVVRSATCDGSTAVGSGNPRKFAVLYKMEGGGAYCANMQ